MDLGKQLNLSPNVGKPSLDLIVVRDIKEDAGITQELTVLLEYANEWRGTSLAVTVEQGRLRLDVGYFYHLDVGSGVDLCDIAARL